MCSLKNISVTAHMLTIQPLDVLGLSIYSHSPHFHLSCFLFYSQYKHTATPPTPCQTFIQEPSFFPGYFLPCCKYLSWTVFSNLWLKVHFIYHNTSYYLNLLGIDSACVLCSSVLLNHSCDNNRETAELTFTCWCTYTKK